MLWHFGKSCIKWLLSPALLGFTQGWYLSSPSPVPPTSEQVRRAMHLCVLPEVQVWPDIVPPWASASQAGCSITSSFIDSCPGIIQSKSSLYLSGVFLKNGYLNRHVGEERNEWTNHPFPWFFYSGHLNKSATWLSLGQPPAVVLVTSVCEASGFTKCTLEAVQNSIFHGTACTTHAGERRGHSTVTAQHNHSHRTASRHP